MVMRTAPNQMMASMGEINQKAMTCLGEAMRSPTAWMMTAERAALGIQ